jgi:uncharacterized paraquat-inducible protein A
MPMVSSLTFVTAILVPALELGLMLYLLMPLYSGACASRSKCHYAVFADD